ncbi:putative UPF0481 protein At3g02645 [Cornus florida]|uniref:putative UPF0481 protein At3g02645 n=1 Tax=Cornus florida TaxID=4283 RepID=UPI00289AEBE2|nr:putative UPF0481 protein At3g02645 [Cornus florida]
MAASMEAGLLNSIQQKISHNTESTQALENFGWSVPRIPVMHRVPDVLRRQKQKQHVYSPTTVSIGPIHNIGAEPHLQEMEEIKLSYMHMLFNRCGQAKFKQAQKDCVDAMGAMEGDVQKCFAEVKLDKNPRLAEIILIDGCFLIELFFRNYRKEQDPILWNPFKYYAVQRDLLLLENQIPFFVLEKLFELLVKYIEVVEGKPNPSSVNECVISFFAGMMGLEINNAPTEDRYNRTPSDILTNKREAKVRTPHHILHLLHTCYVPCIYEEEWKTWEQRNKEVPGFKYAATQLDIAGVKLQAREKTNLFKLKFTTPRHCFCLWRKGQFEIPPFTIDESTEPLLRNLIAFEQCNPGFLSFFTSHAFLMDILIDTEDDVKLLEEVGIISNCSGSREAVLQIFNDICKNAVPRYFLYADLWKNVKDFCTPRRVGFRKLIRYYFGNIWIRVSVIGAILLFILTFLQTFFTIASST